MKNLIQSDTIEKKIYLIRGQKVMLDMDLAGLYGVGTKNLNKAVTRNRGRFPGDFMFRLAPAEAENLRFQIGTSSWGGRRYLPYAFTEQGVAMLSGVLKSRRAIRVNIAIMRVFVKIKSIVSLYAGLAEKLEKLERKTEKYDAEITLIFEAIRNLIAQPEKPKKRIGFTAKEKRAAYFSRAA